MHAPALLLAALVLACSACSVPLAPRADAALAAELRSTNRDAQVLLQQLRAPSPGPCAARGANYADLIGRLRALEMQASARELPPASLLARLEGRIDADPAFSAQPSARALRGAASTLEQMQLADCAGRLHGAALSAFVAQADIFLEQALAYEAMLER
ncbi:hypothetical protein GALL_357710 [mine drainage metagenome]|jgi:hypothetical protein|uniref:Uncharacterized protein n=1 Tax=mine drainage metagenome TaxID=410659 RepID=A0A1J5QFX4_9ZZZZ